MSTFFTQKKTCGNCRRRVSLNALGSTNAFGSPDLDLRPPPMQRYTMQTWVEVCPHCGYVGDDIAAKPHFDPSYLTCEAYQACDGIPFSTELAKDFYRNALLLLLKSDLRGAYQNLHYTAWCCDDSRDTENAIACRRRMDELYAKLPSASQEDPSSVIRHIDVLRRAKLFDKAISLCDAFVSDDAFLHSLVEFERKKAHEADVAVYTVADAKA